MLKRKTFLVLAALAGVTSACSSKGVRESDERVPLAVRQTAQERARSEATGKRFMISTQGTAATSAAKAMFDQGGNIIDASIAASFAISVERPHSTGLAGGGFMLYREAKTGKTYAIDFRERAPLKAREKMYLDKKGDVIENLSLDGVLAVGVPGNVAGFLEIQRRFGKLPLEKVMQPAIELAEKGFPVYQDLADALDDRKAVLAKFPASRAIFLKADGTPYKVGETLVQKDLARTLRLIARQGAKAFYHGEIARKLVATMQKYHGLVSMKDLAEYKVKWHEPVHGTFDGYEIFSMPPPSSGGTHVIEILNILEGLHLSDYAPDSPQAIHLAASAMQLAFADRAKFMGDPAFVKIPLAGLTSKSYAAGLRAKIDPEHAKPADEVSPGTPPAADGPGDTTHFSVMDNEGNVVVSTQTINGWMGSSVTVAGTGMVLNNEMDDFSAKPGAQNLFGAVGSEANSIQPKKTPLSSMSPTIVLKDGQPMMAVGAPGGTRIITCVAQTLLNYLEFKLPLYESVTAVRYHQQWKPDVLQVEKELPMATQGALVSRGWKLKPGEVECAVMAVAREGDHFRGVSDPRDAGAAAGE